MVLSVKNAEILEVFHQIVELWITNPNKNKWNFENEIAKKRNCMTTNSWIFEFGAVQKFVHLVDLVNSFQTIIRLKNSASIQPRTGLSKFATSWPTVRKTVLICSNKHRQTMSEGTSKLWAKTFQEVVPYYVCSNSKLESIFSNFYFANFFLTFLLFRKTISWKFNKALREISGYSKI